MFEHRYNPRRANAGQSGVRESPSREIQGNPCCLRARRNYFPQVCDIGTYNLSGSRLGRSSVVGAFLCRAHTFINGHAIRSGSGLSHRENMSKRDSSGASRFSALATLMFIASIGVMGGCGDKASTEKKSATQIAAKVNKGEISLLQINNALQRAGNLPPEQSKVVSKQILEKLIDQELLVQQAEEKNLERDPRVMQALLAAKREILARAVLEQVSSNVAKPDAKAISDFYQNNPALFKERRIFNLQELAINADHEQVAAVQSMLLQKKPINELVSWLKENKVAFNANAAVKAAEQLPLESLPKFQQAKDGDAIVFPTEKGVTVVFVMATQARPLDETAARPFIEQYLVNQKRTELAANEIKQLRAAAKIQYEGDFAGPASGTTQFAVDTSVSTPASPSKDESTIEKGLSGLK